MFPHSPAQLLDPLAHTAGLPDEQERPLLPFQIFEFRPGLRRIDSHPIPGGSIGVLLTAFATIPGRDVRKALEAAKQQAAKLTAAADAATAAAFDAGGAPVGQLGTALEAARVAAAEADREELELQAEWTAAVGSGRDATALEQRITTLRARREIIARRGPVLEPGLRDARRRQQQAAARAAADEHKKLSEAAAEQLRAAEEGLAADIARRLPALVAALSAVRTLSDYKPRLPSPAPDDDE